MRVVQVVPRYYPNGGGVEVLVQKLSEDLARRGFEMIVYCMDGKNKWKKIEKINGVNIKRFKPLIEDPLFLPNPSFIMDLRAEKADIIHVHNIHTSLPLFSTLSRNKSQKLLLQPHYHRYGQSIIRNSFLELYKRISYKFIFSLTNCIVANSVSEKQMLIDDFPFAKNLFLLPEGLDVTLLLNVKRKHIDKKNILFIGVLKPYKNVDKVLRAFTYLVKNSGEQFRLTLVGEGPERDSLIKLAESLGIDQLVDWKMKLPQKELLDEYAKASAFIMLSPLESFSRVVYDALIIGLPVVVYNFGVLSSLVSQGLVEGVDSLDPKTIADALRKALRTSYPRISLAGNTFLDWSTYVDTLIDLYKKL